MRKYLQKWKKEDMGKIKIKIKNISNTT